MGTTTENEPTSKYDDNDGFNFVIDDTRSICMELSGRIGLSAFTREPVRLFCHQNESFKQRKFGSFLVIESRPRILFRRFFNTCRTVKNHDCKLGT